MFWEFGGPRKLLYVVITHVVKEVFRVQGKAAWSSLVFDGIVNEQAKSVVDGCPGHYHVQVLSFQVKINLACGG